MSVSVRFFLFAPAGLQRISERQLSDLTEGNEAVPDYAGLKLKLAQVVLLLQNRKACRILEVYGTYLDFDEHGKADIAFDKASRAGIELVDKPLNLDHIKRAKVVSLKPMLDHKRYHEQHRWTPSRQEINTLIRAIFK